MSPNKRREVSVAVTGIGITCALGNGVEQVWRAVRDGVSGIGKTRRLDVSALSCQYSGEVQSVPVNGRRITGRQDRATRLALAAVDEAVSSAHLSLPEFDPYRVGVAVGTSVGGLDQGERFHWDVLEGGAAAGRPGQLTNYALYTSADAISVAFRLQGPKVVISNACAAGANSIGYAVDTIREGRADVMVAGGVDVLDILSLAGFDSLNALDPEPCAPYSRSTGLNLGEGAAFLVLEAESVARRRQAPVLGYVLGYALTSDAYHATAPDPAGSGASRAMRRGLAQASLTPDQVDYVNGHGTGTPTNDKAEAKAVADLFADSPSTPMSSTKSQVGHMLGAAGAMEAATCVLALRDGVIPPTVNVDDASRPPRDIVANTSRPQALDVVVSNSFAFGGNNCSLVLGRRPIPPALVPDHRVVITGAGPVTALGSGRQALVDALKAGTSAIGEARLTDLPLSRTQRAAEIDSAECRRHVDPAYARRLDQIGLLTLAASRIALSDAGLRITKANAERVGLIFGTFSGPIQTVAQLSETIGTVGPHRVNPRLFPNSVMNAAAGHACLALQIRGPLSTLATGCASGLSGLAYAADLVRRGEADVMLAVSADELTPLLHCGFDRMGLLSDTTIRPYDQAPSGMVLGAGSTALVVESLDHALSRGATILAEIRGHAVTSDAYRVAGNDPSGRAWAESFHRALADAGLSAGDIGTVYGDARGTAPFDLAEARAVAEVFQPGSVQLSNLSPYVGHVHSTTSLMSTVCATETVRTGWSPQTPAPTHPVEGVAEFLRPRDGAGAPCLITAANWGGTYVSLVLAPFHDTQPSGAREGA
ncbi:beta-ketoacyl-[acyl-carrier-protein] synthase family protein [Streptomyces sp. ISL-22]|uniref:beta-ketoacyl-[acyl-carrier-protein] synthase family protein n=1 Tax=unclassified Streptomyces TaxID=2593676 RepID=UPI001BEC3748|nr:MULTISPECIES: beta-ketoacyl-[acyl-carrier-protein] synthase family protein [unclassified Streptomyces]MBT2418873.1 beta-ketoacyl-[acyl-carrier-protein] synthase family protein [Streptomyces sp. ISL-24]MBT2435694.1 beta-ketoacyl-[acyl-carrier-protein] synthase family protein [Streptomyces sp. ISL-22]